jgi:hypothetical protein
MAKKRCWLVGLLIVAAVVGLAGGAAAEGKDDPVCGAAPAAFEAMPAPAGGALELSEFPGSPCERACFEQFYPCLAGCGSNTACQNVCWSQLSLCITPCP